MYKYPFLLFLIIFINCSYNNPNSYFEFNKIEYYRLDKNYIDLNKDSKVINPLDTTNIAVFQFNVINTSIPLDLNNNQLQNKLKEIGFSKLEIPEKYYKDIDKIFSYKEYKESFQAMCLPSYRDILIFKKENEIIGIAKICFQCGQHAISGASGETDWFGGDGDYEKLEKILYQE
ncbi:hypothetical protein [Faecalibacter bovis]|uniref:DUF4830 domain-containing protein n=1 Tax=Faecalibacter bovis TaxID=2898187 RepID=A0ABX7XE81_9FLAO|nr:hypothetical protein [Faecalibacter bovis]QTV06187.1 hypothetical protein J9309_02285 [Faecalibacter bovis]